ncbi:MAG: cation-transporting P-type ATPase, partial [Verrucomicrobiota bacterium]
MSKPYTQSTDEVLKAQGCDPEQGLSQDEAQRRFEKEGANRLEQDEGDSAWVILGRQFKSVIIWVLLAALVVALIFQKWPEAIAVAAVILVNTLVSFIAEWKAQRTMDALRRKEEAECTVLRDCEERRIPVAEVVGGDLLVLEPEDL